MVALALILFFVSCDKEEPIPSYIHIPAIDLNVVSNGTQGSNAHNIVDAWVYVGSDFIGVFELPTTIPILKEGEQEILIVAGVKKNALSTSRVPYPFFKPYKITQKLTPALIDTLFPVVTYNSSLNFVWMEDFEDQTISMEKSGNTTTIDSMSITDLPSEVFEWDDDDNKYSGVISMDTGFQIFEHSTVKLFDLPRGGQDIYLELNFNTNTEFIVGIYPITGSVVQGVPIVNLYPTDGKWKKVYISLKEDVNSAAYQGAEFRVVFNAQTNSDGKIPKIYLDNIKLIHF